MHRKQGFTLVELLVVMAIIAILASIVVPNVTRYIRRSRAITAMTEIRSIDMSLTKMVTDANVDNLHQLFDPNEVQGTLFGAAAPVPMNLWNQSDFETAQQLYTNTFYALLRLGRGALTEVDPDFSISYSQILRDNVVQKLGTDYLEIAFDPWGQKYEIYPGPWPVNAGAPIPFRIFVVDAEELQLPGAGRYTDGNQGAYVDGATGETFTAGYAANRERAVFIYSKGENQVSGQFVFPTNGYDSGQETEYMQGGDDVNSWDKGQSYMRFYN